jgi:hypothetical protein
VIGFDNGQSGQGSAPAGFFGPGRQGISPESGRAVRSGTGGLY